MPSPHGAGGLTLRFVARDDRAVAIRGTLWVLTVAALAPASAQESRAARARLGQRLRADPSAEVASAAYAVARDALRDLGPELGSALRRVNAGADTPARTATAAALLDALVQTGTRVPEDLLQPWCERPATRGAVMAIVSRTPADHGHILARWFDDQSHGLSWMFACALRLDADPRTTVPLLVQGAAPTVRVGVHEAVMPWVQEAEGLRVPPAETLPELPDFPPAVRYQWSWQPGPRAVPMGPRLGGWFLDRVEVGDAHFGLQSFAHLSPAQFALRTLAEVAGTPPFEPVVTVDHVWRDAATLLTAVTPPLQAHRGRWRALLDALRAKGLLDARAAAAAGERLGVEFVDQRADRSVPLPKVR